MRNCQILGLNAAVIALFALLCAAAASAAAEPRKAAVFDFELIDQSPEGELNGKRDDETEWLAVLTKTLRERLAASGRYAVVDLSPAAQQIEQASPLYKCNDCIGDLSKAAGTEVAFTGYVQKASAMILKAVVILWDGKTGKPLKTWSSELRGDTEEFWLRGLNSLLDRRILSAEDAQ